MGSMVFTVMAALAQMELEIKRERVNDSNAKRRAAVLDLGGRCPVFSDNQINNTRRLIEQGNPLPTSPEILACPAPPGTGASPNLTHARGQAEPCGRGCQKTILLAGCPFRVRSFEVGPLRFELLREAS
jgi:hypothetical protein